MYEDQDEDEYPQEFQKSKTATKREMIELQQLGERLLELNPDQLKKLVLPDELIVALKESKKITAHGAKRRHLQFIGRLMRKIEDPQPIRDYLQELQTKNQRASAYHHMLESWREKLITQGPQILTEYFEAYPDAQRQHLRQLVQNAQKERATGKPKGAGKLLFRYLKEIHEQKESNS